MVCMKVLIGSRALCRVKGNERWRLIGAGQTRQQRCLWGKAETKDGDGQGNDGNTAVNCLIKAGAALDLKDTGSIITELF